MPKVGLFISWSGNSREIAEMLYEWLPTTLHSIEPWMSDQDIAKGSRFLEEIDRALVQCKAGLVCLTPENCQSVWVAFEAGALASRMSSSKLVIPLILRMRHADVPGPLSMFQASMMTKNDMLRLVLNLNELNDDGDKISEKRLTTTFLGVWPNLERQLPALEEATKTGIPVQGPPEKSDTQLLEEILDVTKSVRILVEDRLRDVITDTPVSGTALKGRDSYTAQTETLLNASEIWLVGVSLLTVLDQYFDVFSEYVERDQLNLRFMLLDPDDTVLIETATRSLYGVTTHDELQQDILNATAKMYLFSCLVPWLVWCELGLR
jgi:hypothetical protein